jgi:hypothetical protein
MEKLFPFFPEVVYAVAQNWDGRRVVFLQDGDALVYPFLKLRGMLPYLNEKLPCLEGIGTYFSFDLTLLEDCKSTKGKR